MRKFFILLAASILCFACKSGSDETPAKLVAERVHIGDLYYNLYNNNTAEVTYELLNDPDNYAYLEGEVIIPSSIQVKFSTYTVTGIGSDAFRGCTGLTSITIPNSVTSIGFAAFIYCTGLKSPVYNDHVFACLPPSFEGAYVIPAGIEQIAVHAFANCQNLTSITIPNSVTSIGECAFLNCTGLTSVTIPNSVTSIGYGVFFECTGLTSITIPNSVTSIGDWAFNLCKSLTSITIPNSVTSIGEKAFKDCTGLKSVVLPQQSIEIADNAFENCLNVKITYVE